MTRILLVEDDDFLRQALRDYLMFKEYHVTEAPNGKVGRDIMSCCEFELVISDVQMPLMNGVELLKWIKEERPTPFILMTGFSELLETQSAFSLGADSFLVKPFKNMDLLEAINEALSAKPSQTMAYHRTEANAVGRVMHIPGSQQNLGNVTQVDEAQQPLGKVDAVADVPAEKFSVVSVEDRDEEFGYCRVAIDEFVSRPTIDFDIYVKLGREKFLKIAHKGHTLDVSRIQTYRAKGLRFLYVKKTEVGKIINFNLEVASKLTSQKDISIEKKMNFVRHTGEILLEKCFVDGVDPEAVRDATELINSTVNIISGSQEKVDLIDLLNQHADYIYAHSVCVAMYATLIAQKIGHYNRREIQDLASAAIFHDIGKKEIDRDLLIKPRPQLTSLERSLIETHVIRSREILEEIPGMSSTVIRLVFEHHEDEMGTGYPQRLRGHQMHHLSKILIVANKFAELVIKKPNKRALSGIEAIQHIEAMEADRVDIVALEALKTVYSSQSKKTAV